MPLATLLPLLFGAVGAVNSGYQFLSKWEADHPGSKLTPEHLQHLKDTAPDAFDACTKAQADWATQEFQAEARGFADLVP